MICVVYSYMYMCISDVCVYNGPFEREIEFLL